MYKVKVGIEGPVPTHVGVDRLDELVARFQFNYDRAKRNGAKDTYVMPPDISVGDILLQLKKLQKIREMVDCFNAAVAVALAATEHREKRKAKEQ